MKMKSLPLLFAVIGVVLLFTFSFTDKTSPSNPEVVRASTQVSLSPELSQEKYTMKLAWYRYFNIHKSSQNKNIQSKSPLYFAIKKGEKGSTFINLELVNVSEEIVQLQTQNGSLIMIQEARNQKGQWQPIEYWDFDWGAGSIFEELELKSKEAISISAPLYQGEFKTKFRFKLRGGKTKHQKDLYFSDSFEGSIDPSQFNLAPKMQDESVSYLEK